MIYKNPLFFLLKTLFLLCMLSLLCQCKKEDDKQDDVILDKCCLPEPTDTLYMSQELKSYFYFPEGSWWVYQRTDTNTAVYDTAKVVRVINEIFYNQFATYAWEKITVVVEHSYYPSPPNAVSPHLSVSFQNLNTQVDRIIISSSGKLLTYLPNVISVPIDSLSMANKSRGGRAETTLIDTNNITINNTLFDHTLHMKYGFPGFEYEIWFAKSRGIIKYYNADDQTNWEIVNLNIK